MVVRYEPPSLAVLPIRTAGAGVSSTTRLFNAQLDIEDGEGAIRPYLAEALPQLNTDTWRVLPDGRMETSYHLHPNLTWHDGAPLTGDDFSFAWRVYREPSLGVASRVLDLIEDVSAPDPRTVVIHWKQPYPDAGGLRFDFQPLPQHILAEPFSSADPDAFSTSSFWTVDYVGAGPFRVGHWEQGASLEAIAFDGHVLGRPRLDRINIRFIPDENTALTTLLAGEAQYATGRSLRFEHASVLKREWGAAGKGVVLLTPDTMRYTSVQFRPDLVNPAALLDLRVRKGIVSAIDRQALNDALFDGGGSMSDMFLTKHAIYDHVPDMDRTLAEADKAMTHYPFDPRRAEDYLASAGFHKGQDGIQTSANGERLSMEVWADAGPQYEKEQAVLADTWQSVGIDSHASFVPPARLRDGQFRSSFPALHTTSAGRLESLASSGIPTAQNHWAGSNRGSWSNPQYDQLWDAFNTTLDPQSRSQQVVQMLKLASDELPSWVLYYNLSVSAHVSALKGPDNSGLNSDTWNVYEWEISR